MRKASVDTEAFQTALLGWYDNARRDLPWRARAGTRADPYRVWLSEIMLQQTTVKAVIPYFEAFLERWPTVGDLAKAPRDDVLAAWAGLGYYSRARNLHACAQSLHERGFPETEDGLRRLPGIGAYTSAAIASIAFDVKATVIDGNVERVIARLFAIETPLPKAKIEIGQFAAKLTSNARPGDYAQAMMDLGATICTPKAPRCFLCPVRGFCAAVDSDPSRFPVKAARSVRPKRAGRALIIVAWVDSVPCVLLRRRGDKGLLGGMLEPPNIGWKVAETSSPSPSASTMSEPDIVEWWRDVMDTRPREDAFAKGTRRPENVTCVEGETVRHVFTHFELDFAVSAIRIPPDFEFVQAEESIWVPVADLEHAALPTVMLKAVISGLKALGIPAPYETAGSSSKRRSKVSTVEMSARPSTKAGRK